MYFYWLIFFILKIEGTLNFPGQNTFECVWPESIIFVLCILVVGHGHVNGTYFSAFYRTSNPISERWYRQQPISDVVRETAEPRVTVVTQPIKERFCISHRSLNIPSPVKMRTAFSLSQSANALRQRQKMSKRRKCDCWKSNSANILSFLCGTKSLTCGYTERILISDNLLLDTQEKEK